MRFEFGVHGVGFSGVVGRSERATDCVRWEESLLFIHPPSRVFYLHLAVRHSRRTVRLFRQFLLGERSDKFKHGHSVVFVEMQVGKQHVLRVERVSVAFLGLSWLFLVFLAKLAFLFVSVLLSLLLCWLSCLFCFLAF